MELERLKQSRTVIRSSITRLSNDIKAICKTSSWTKEKARELKRKTALLAEKEVALKQLDCEIQRLIPLEEMETEEEGKLRYEETIIDAKESASDWEEQSSSSSPTTGPSSSSTLSVSEVKSLPKLPKLTIQPFEGDVLKWTTFWDHFSATIHYSGLGDIEKFGYLKSLLTGEAARVISGLSLTSANYGAAITKLKDRFGDINSITQHHFTSLVSIEPMKPPGTLKELIRVYDTVDSHVKALEELGVEENTYGTLLYSTLRSLVSKRLLYDFAETEREETAAAFMKFLATKIRHWRRCETFGFENTVERSGKNTGAKQRVCSASALISSTSKNFTPYCIFCNKKGHWTSDCDINRTLAQKKEILKQKNRCFKCLKSSHLAKDCKSRTFTCRGCGGQHTSAMCDQSGHRRLSVNSFSTNNASSMDRDQNQPVTSLTVVNDNLQAPVHSVHPLTTLLQTAFVRLRNGSRCCTARCLLDSGSSRTFISERTKDQLGLKTNGNHVLNVFSFGGQQSTLVCQTVSFILESRDGQFSKRISALTVPNISAQVLPFLPSNVADELKRMGLFLADEVGTLCYEGKGDIEVLIGSDQCWLFLTGETLQLTETLVASNSKLGWLIQGPYSASPSKKEVTSNLVSVSVLHVTVNFEKQEDPLDFLLRQFLEVEQVIQTPPIHQQKNQDIIQQFEQSITRRHERYEVSLPWREDMEGKLVDNYDLAKGRLFHLLKRLRCEPELLTEYDTILKKYQELGYVEVVEQPEEEHPLGTVYYMPHRYVRKEDRNTTKIRIVFDASAHKENEFSLNDCLYPGPNLTAVLIRILLQFRASKIAITADIEQAFLQIGLAEKDRDSVRFLWFDNVTEIHKPSKLITLRMKRVPFGVTSSPFLLAATLMHHFNHHEDKEIVRTVKEKFYVDDLVTGTETVDAAITLQKRTQEMLGEAGMNIRKWRTSEQTLREKWRQGSVDLHPKDNSNKVLGLLWDDQGDMLSLAWKNVDKSMSTTKRKIIGVASQLYDPLGLVSPFVLRAKILFQKLWALHIGWDDPVPSELLPIWERWINEVQQLQHLKFTRWYQDGLGDEAKTHELHIFCDASRLAYAAAVYLRTECETGRVKCQLIFSKSRVAPIKTQTIPRLELLAALMGVQVANIVKSCMPYHISRITYWTDSQIVLFWITTSGRKKDTFVEHKVKIIQRESDICNWKHCPGAFNPADVATREISLTILSENKLWWEGPPWLQENTYVPENCQILFMPHDIIEKTASLSQMPPSIYNLNRTNRLMKVLRITGWILRFCDRVRHITTPMTNYLSLGEVLAAELYWIKWVQQTHYGEELRELSAQKKISKSSRILMLNPMLDETGLLCITGRIQGSEEPWALKHPVILPGKSRFSLLLITDAHEKLKHAGVNDTLVCLRQRFWIVQGRSACKSVIHKCLICCRQRSKTMEQTEAPLPLERVKITEPFSTVGVDFAGPIYIKTKDGPAKVYFALFTCATIRAIHLEVVNDLTTESFLLSFRRFVGRRGIPNKIWSDNGKTFKRAHKDLQLLQNVTKDPDVIEFLQHHRISWDFITEHAPWWGGFWERMVRSVKDALRRCLGHSLLWLEEFTTLLVEVEAVINDRPLTYVYSEVGEPEPLTPSQLLTSRRIYTLPHYVKTESLGCNSGTAISKRLKYRLLLHKHCINRWRKEYLLQLRSFHLTKVCSESHLEVGKVVLLKEDKVPRHLWRLARVEDVYPGRDGKIRSCTLRVTGRKLLRRPVQLICPLECDDKEGNIAVPAPSLVPPV